MNNPLAAHTAPQPERVPILRVITAEYAFQVLELIRRASASIDVLSYVVKFNTYKKSDKANLIYLALKNFAAKGRPVRVILDYPKPYKPNYNCNRFSVRRFKEASFNVKYLHSGQTQHAKLFIFDQSLALFGSHNWTTKSVISRYDVSLFLNDPGVVSYLNNYYNSLWQLSIEA